MKRSSLRNRRHRNPQIKESDQHQPFFPKSNLGVVKNNIPFFQTKLSIGQPGDKYEQEANNMANQVVNGPKATSPVQLKKISSIQRNTLADNQEEEPIQRLPEEEDETIQMLSSNEKEGDKVQLQFDEEEDQIQTKESEEEDIQMQEEEDEPVQMMENEEEEVQMQEEEEKPIQMMEGEEEDLQMKPEAANKTAKPKLGSCIRNKAGKGNAIPKKHRSEMENAFGKDFSGVNIHTDAESVQMNKELGAHAFTHGKDVYFNAGKYSPENSEGKQLLAHELTHVVQQNSSLVDKIQRSCLPAAECPTVVSGSVASFSTTELAAEVSPRARRQRMTCTRATSTGHAGHARQLERIFVASDPTAFSQIHGVFLDADMSRGTAAMVTNCTDWASYALPAGCDPPSISGASRPCVIVPGYLNQEAYIYNNTDVPNIGGIPREDWRIQTVQTLIHEAQHVVFDEASRPEPPGVSASCPRNSIHSELSELNAILSEFPTVYRAIPASGPGRTRAIERLNEWFNHAITNPYQSIAGTLKAVRCVCDCSDINSHVRDVFEFVSNGWTANEKTVFHTELRKSRWNANPINLNWPL